jgi:SAM-dependent methyltransferase
LLRQFDNVGEQLWDPEVFKQTEYYQNAVLNIELFGRYHNAIAPDQIQWGARRFVQVYRGLKEILPMQEGEFYTKGTEEIAVRPVMYSTCYQILEGHHRLAIAYVKGARQARALIEQPATLTPLQELLLDASWLKGRRELYQPIDSAEVARWTLVRRCSDRLAKMTGFLRAEGLMPPVSGSYLDVASGYGWFVSAMAKVGFRAEGVELDPTAISIGTLIYGLAAEQVHRSDSVAFLRSLEGKCDVTSCLSLVHHYILNRKNVSAEELLRLLDSVTGRVMFFDMGQSHEYPGPELEGWDPDHIHRWLQANTTFTRIVRLGPDEDAIPPNQHNFGRMLFACIR